MFNFGVHEYTFAKIFIALSLLQINDKCLLIEKVKGVPFILKILCPNCVYKNLSVNISVVTVAKFHSEAGEIQ